MRHHDCRPPVNPDRGAPGCDDQLPLISRVGRGIHGDGYMVEIDDPDSVTETRLHGYEVDGATGEVRSDWVSENINGGQLSYQYNLRPFTVPQTFTITFVYRRPGRPEWTWTTPAIPYVWSVDEDGNKDQGDGIVGSGVATLFVKKTTDPTWREMLLYPEGTTREDFNAPEAEEPWTVNLTFGVGGDIDVPSVDDLLDYIDRQDDNHLDSALDHLHDDLGFSDGFLPGDGGSTSVKEYIDDKASQAEGDVTSLRNYVSAALGDILAKFYGGGTLGSDGHVTWGASGKAAVGNMNVYAGGADSSAPNAIRTRADSTSNENDVQVI